MTVNDRRAGLLLDRRTVAAVELRPTVGVWAGIDWTDLHRKPGTGRGSRVMTTHEGDTMLRARPPGALLAARLFDHLADGDAVGCERALCDAPVSAVRETTRWLLNAMVAGTAAVLDATGRPPEALADALREAAAGARAEGGQR